jgi:serine/threonine protein kinase
LAVVYFSFITDKKPFATNCKVNELEAILTLVGSERFLEVYEKYQKASAMEVSLIEEIKANRKLFEGISLSDRIPDEYAKHFDDQLLDLLAKMLEVDPEYRLTITEVLNHPYFDRVKRLPKMYEEKNKRKKASAEKPQKHAPAPANNLVPPPEYFQ